MASNRKRSGVHTKPLQWASSDKPLWAEDADGLSVRLTALSPSDASVTVAAELIGKDLSAGYDVSRLPRVTNEDSVALWLQFDDVGALLGADLEVTSDPARGWDAVLNLLEDPPHGLGAVIKVPHHGSANAHHDDVWSKMLQKKPVALVAPWRGGGKSLPTSEDLTRLCSLSGAVFVTHPPNRDPGPESPPGVGPTWVSEGVGAVGRITLTRNGGGEWAEEVIPPAVVVFRLPA